MTQTFLVIGGDSMIGRALADSLVAAGRDVRVTTRRQDTAGNDRLYLDLARPAREWPPLPDADVWILSAAISQLGACDDNPEGSSRINVDAMTELARIGAEKGSHILFLSSDKVFDGSVANRPAGDLPCAATVYGQQKAEAERNILALGDVAGVVRLAKVLQSQSSLLAGWVEDLDNGVEIRAFRDMTMAPVPLDSVVDTLTAAADRRLSGILQVSGPRDISYTDAAKHIAGRLRADPALIHQTRAADNGISPERRPPYTSMDTGRLASDLGINIPDAFDVLDALYGLRQP